MTRADAIFFTQTDRPIKRFTFMTKDSSGRGVIELEKIKDAVWKLKERDKKNER